MAASLGWPKRGMTRRCEALEQDDAILTEMGQTGYVRCIVGYAEVGSLTVAR